MNVTTLALYNNEISGDVPAWLSGGQMERIVSLDIEYNRALGGQVADDFWAFRNLQQLFLGGTQIDHLGGSDVLHGLVGIVRGHLLEALQDFGDAGHFPPQRVDSLGLAEEGFVLGAQGGKVPGGGSELGA